MSGKIRSYLLPSLGLLSLTAWSGCETHVSTDAPPPSRVDVQVERPGVDVDVNRTPGGGIDVDVDRKRSGIDVDVDRKLGGADVDVDVKPNP
jgi:hypothetical protein